MKWGKVALHSYVCPPINYPTWKVFKDYRFLCRNLAIDNGSDSINFA